MIILFRRIPENTQKHEIESFIKPILKGRIFQKTGYIEHIKILILKDTQTNTLEFHGLITIDPDKAAKWVIKKLNRKMFKGKHIQVREYFHRLCITIHGKISMGRSQRSLLMHTRLDGQTLISYKGIGKYKNKTPANWLQELNTRVQGNRVYIMPIILSK